MITHMAFGAVAVADQDVMIDFFVGKLGFTKTTDGEMWPGARWVAVTPPGAQTDLVLNRASDFDREPDKHYAVGFACADLSATAEHLRAQGVEVTDPVTEPWGSYIRVTDPEGRELLINNRS